MDVFSPEKRSDIMRHVKSSGNRSTEERMITFFKYFASRKQLSFWTAVFGMGMIVEILVRRKTRNIGKRKELKIWPATLM